MNIKALITSAVLLGTSSIAMARPAVTVSANAEWSYRSDRGPVVRDHRTYDQYGWDRGRDYGRPYVNHGYDRDVLLADSVKIGNGETRKFVDINANHDRFRTLTVSNAGGRLLLKQLRIDFADGTTQHVKGIDRVLTGNAAVDIPLDGRGKGITRVIVYAENYGRNAAAAFDLTAS